MSRSLRRYRRGMSLLEVMISLIITSMLLAAVATAFTTSASAVQMNDDFFRASQAARVSMNQILTEIRRCDSVRVLANGVEVIRPVENLEASEIYRRFAYDSADKKLTIQIFTTGDVGGPVYVLASNVTSAAFGPAETDQDSNNAQVVVRVPIALKVQVGKNDVRLNGSAGPRRALRY